MQTPATRNDIEYYTKMTWSSLSLTLSMKATYYPSRRLIISYRSGQRDFSDKHNRNDRHISIIQHFDIEV